ncbi:CDC42 small effector protein 2 [Ciona intestinalis]|uniref:CRIB domain-containing protein n=1 Tax=Ciona intestinalis TaxID=7719 RepID=H2XYC4_CIOIN
MAEMWLCFSCCMTSSGTSNKRKPRRRKLDPSMIGAPANFQHLNHIGSGESGGAEMQDNMQSKGGYEFRTEVTVERKLAEVKRDAS